MSFYIFYLHIGIAIAVLLVFLPTFISSIADDVEKWLPRTAYIDNEEHKKEAGSSSHYFRQLKLPDIENNKNVPVKYAVKKENFVTCFITLFIIGIMQLI